MSLLLLFNQPATVGGSGPHPVGLITRPVSGLWGGRRVGSFAGKTPDVPSGHPVELITRVVTGLYGGKRTGSFAGKAGEVTSGHPVELITRVVSGLWGGRRVGSFAGKTLSLEIVVPFQEKVVNTTSSGIKIHIAELYAYKEFNTDIEVKNKLIQQDEELLTIISFMVANKIIT